MAYDASGWLKVADPSRPEGILQWVGSGAAPWTDPGTQRALRSALGFSDPSAASPTTSASGGGEGFDFASLFSEGGGSEGGGGLVPYKPGPITSVVNDLLTAAIKGGGLGGPAGKTLYSLSGGNIPEAIQKQFQMNLDRSNANVTERMGLVGQRFGTDLTRTLSEASNLANVNLSAAAMDRALAAISQIIGLGTGQSALELQGSEGALNRASQQFMASQANDPMLALLQLLLSAGGGGGGGGFGF